MKWFYLFIVTLISSSPLVGQVTFQPKKPSRTMAVGVVYNKEQTIHFKFHTRGFAVGYDFGKIEKYNETTFYTFELGHLKHSKEYRQSIRSVGNSFLGRSLVYGKINNLLVARALFKERKYLSEKAKRDGIAVGYTYSFGITAGILKPYYVKIANYDSPFHTTFREIKYGEETKEEFLDLNKVSGAAGFFKGFSEAKIVPGLSGGIGVLFDIGAYEQFAKSIEAGIMVDLFPRVMPIMINTQNSPIFINAYISFNFGKRW